MKTLYSAILVAVFLVVTASQSWAAITCWFPPGWAAKGPQAQAITTALTEKSGLAIKPRIAKSYGQILKAFDSDNANLVYVGSFVQAIIEARGLGKPLAQSINEKELYGSWMIYPAGQDPQSILKESPAKIAFAKGASSGESGAKAATGGKAAIATPNHRASAGAVKSGNAAAAFVKNWWWEAGKGKLPGLEVYQVPGVSDVKNPDNILTASNSVSATDMEKIKKAALASPKVFGGNEMREFAGNLEFSLGLMKKGKMDPLTYTW